MKAATQSLPPASQLVSVPLTDTSVTPTAELQNLQSRATSEEKVLLKKSQAHIKNDVWYGPNDKPCLPKYLFPFYAKLTHGKDHVSEGRNTARNQQILVY